MLKKSSKQLHMTTQIYEQCPALAIQVEALLILGKIPPVVGTTFPLSIQVLSSTFEFQYVKL